MGVPTFEDPPEIATWARVRFGALSGALGRVCDRRGKNRVLIDLDTKLKGFCLEIDVEMVELLDGPAE